MKRRTASCPSCAAPIEFGFGAVVTVCSFCDSAVGRGDKQVEDYGKVADLMETSTRLRRGLTGTFNKKHFAIAGHVQYRHPAGGVWDEWYLAFPGGRWGWLAEAQGKTYLMFERRLSSHIELPEFDSLTAGRSVRLGDSEFTVTERGIAEALAAEGEIPWAFRSGAEHQFADLQGPDGTFATFEYSQKTHAYVGKEISLDDLQLVGQGWELEEEKIAVTALQLNCPNCAGSLALRAPDQAQRVTCQNCNSLLDVSEGKLSYLKTLKSKENFPIVIPLGSEGELFGHEFTVIGYLRRYAMYEGKTYPWDEFLLYDPSVGFRWLVCNDRHWSFVKPVTTRIGSHASGQSSVHYGGDNFRVYDRGTAYVRYVIGEFYWQVESGETVRTADFIAPPRMLSFEWSKTDKSEELNVSEGIYLPTEKIEQAFGLKNIPRSFSVGMIQPRPRVGSGIFLSWPVMVLLLIATHIAYSKPGPQSGSDPWLCFYGIAFVSFVPIAILVFWYSFEVKRWENSDYSPYATE